MEGGIWPGTVYCLRGLGWVATKPLKLLIFFFSITEARDLFRGLCGNFSW